MGTTNGESLMAQTETYMAEELNKLVGYTVVRTVFAKEVDASMGLNELYPGLLLRNKEGKELAVWFLQDEEDNGAGYYDIQERA